MNLRQDKSPFVPQRKPKFKLKDHVTINSTHGITGVINCVQKYNDDILYIVTTDRDYHIGIPSTDSSIKLLKPIDVIIHTIPVYESEITLTGIKVPDTIDIPF